MFLVAALLFLATIQSASSEYPGNPAEIPQRFAAGHAAISALLQEFGTDGENIKYPDDYVGKYFDEKGYLYILTTKENFEDISFLSDNPVIKDVVIYRYTPHSYNDPRQLRTFLHGYPDYLFKIGIHGISIDNERNALRLELLNMRNKETVLDFLKSNYEGFDESMVVIVQGQLYVLAKSNYA